MKIKFTFISFWLSAGLLCAQPTINIIPFASGFTDGITDIANAGDGRLFVTEQLGYISIIDSTGNVLPNYFLDISNKVTPVTFTPGDEQGLLGLAFSPNFESDGFFYVNYTNKIGVGNTVISRFQVSSNPNVADPLSEEILLTIYQPYANHNGGSLAFGNDGYLYIALGDGGLFGDPGNRAQNTDSLLGKILRIDVSGATGYSIPPTNPFVAGGGAPEVWAYGLRNPWRISFDRLTDNLLITDVGQDMWEEINFQPAGFAGGANYGWRCYEGNHPYNTTGCGPQGSYFPAAFEYAHNTTGGCAITGGYVYRGIDHPDMSGYYFFTDYCVPDIYTLDPALNVSLAGSFSGNNFTTFGENANGELYAGSQNNGIVYRIVSIMTGVDDLADIGLDVLLYPNPGDGQLTCEFTSSDLIKAELEITDIAGRSVYKAAKQLIAGQNSLTVDIRQVASGTYIMQVKTDNGSLYRKIEVMK